MLCLITRLEAKTVSTLLWLLITSLSMRRQARTVPGLHDVWVSFRRPRTVFLISLWDDRDAMAEFATAVPHHASAIMHLWQTGGKSWSGLFELIGPSPASRWWPEHSTATRVRQAG